MRSLASLLLLCVAVSFVACGSSDSSYSPAAVTPQITISSGSTTIPLTVELAYTEAQREKGLMGHTQLDDSSGMLFIFPTDSTIGFWMKGTLIPLDIAYLSANGVVLEIRHGQPLDETILTPQQPYRYTLEVAGGWFSRHDLGTGAIVSLPAALPKAE